MEVDRCTSATGIRARLSSDWPETRGRRTRQRLHGQLSTINMSLKEAAGSFASHCTLSLLYSELAVEHAGDLRPQLLYHLDRSRPLCPSSLSVTMRQGLLAFTVTEWPDGTLFAG